MDIKLIGFIGLGVMGKPMARNLLKAGYSLVVYDVVAAPVTELIAAGARAGTSPRDVAAQCNLMNAMDTAHELGVPAPLTSQVLEIMQALKTDGKARDDHSGLVQFYEQLAKVTVRQ